MILHFRSYLTNVVPLAMFSIVMVSLFASGEDSGE